MIDKPIYFVPEILQMLGISYASFYRRIKKNENLKHLIQAKKRKNFYKKGELDIILQHIV